jgi:drug/metabolite transporter (DMT)-like permease
VLFPRRRADEPKPPWRALALGFFGLFGFHFFYFVALRNAPRAEAVLISYLWPLLLVLFSSFLPGMRISARHLGGAVVGFAGAVVAITGGRGFEIDARYTLGYLAALASAVIWAVYSVLSRRYGHVPVRAVAVSCAMTAAASWVCHFLFETTVWPASWAAVLAMGIGPVGLAFYAWDFGMKHGDIRLLGTLSYLDPILTILLLVLFGLAEPTPALWSACGLIVAGALIASWPLRRTQTL